MDLSSLDTTLPPALADAERDMGDKFRGAAMSITQLYKSSLGYTKQAYQAGYSAALADVLSKVQSDIGSGGDAVEALARLMDWSEARQAAIRTFAEDDEQPAPAAPRPLPAARAPPRPASAPVLDSRVRAGPSTSATASTSAGTSMRAGPSSLRHDTTDGLQQTQPRPASVSSLLGRPERPDRLNLDRTDAPSSSSPAPSTQGQASSPGRPTIAPPRRTPARPQPATNTLNSNATFNFSLPATLSIPAIELPPASGPVQTVPTGAKRPMIDAEMSEDPAAPRQGRGKRRNVDEGRKPRRGGHMG